MMIYVSCWMARATYPRGVWSLIYLIHDDASMHGVRSGGRCRWHGNAMSCMGDVFWSLEDQRYSPYCSSFEEVRQWRIATYVYIHEDSAFKGRVDTFIPVFDENHQSKHRLLFALWQRFSPHMTSKATSYAGTSVTLKSRICHELQVRRFATSAPSCDASVFRASAALLTCINFLLPRHLEHAFPSIISCTHGKSYRI